MTSGYVPGVPIGPLGVPGEAWRLIAHFQASPRSLWREARATRPLGPPRPLGIPCRDYEVLGTTKEVLRTTKEVLGVARKS